MINASSQRHWQLDVGDWPLLVLFLVASTLIFNRKRLCGRPKGKLMPGTVRIGLDAEARGSKVSLQNTLSVL